MIISGICHFILTFQWIGRALLTSNWRNIDVKLTKHWCQLSAFTIFFWNKILIIKSKKFIQKKHIVYETLPKKFTQPIDRSIDKTNNFWNVNERWTICLRINSTWQDRQVKQSRLQCINEWKNKRKLKIKLFCCFFPFHHEPLQKWMHCPSEGIKTLTEPINDSLPVTYAQRTPSFTGNVIVNIVITISRFNWRKATIISQLRRVSCTVVCNN